MSDTKAGQNHGPKPSSRHSGKAGKPGQSGQAGRSAMARRRMTGILLAATAAVIAATVYVVVWDPLRPPPAPSHMDTGMSRGEQVRRKMEEVIAYCKKDVEITKDLFLFGLANGYLLFETKAGQLVRLPVEWNLSRMIPGSDKETR